MTTVSGGNKQNGFSLVELMIVLVIIGILVAIIIPNMMDAKTRAQQRATVAEIRNWGVALGAYMAEVGTVPFGGGGAIPASTIHNLLVPYAVSSLHDQDAWKNDLAYYALATTSINYTVASGGRDGVIAGGAGGFLQCLSEATWFLYDFDIAMADGIYICSPS